MQATGIGYAIHPAATGWFELPASRGFAGYGLGRALGLLLDAMRGLSALNETTIESGELFSHGEFTPLQFRVDPLGVCRLIPLTTRHYVSEYIAPPRATLGFLSPERLIGEKVGLRADVFSAGVLLWEALAGRRLIDDADSDEAICERLMSGKIRVPPLPPQLDWATPLKAEVERALSVNQQRRFANCAEFSEVILRLAQDRVASNDEIAAFFASNFNTAPNCPPISDRGSYSPVEVSRELPVAKRGQRFQMPPFAPLAPVPIKGPIGEAGAERRTTLKMNVTLKMAQVPLPILGDEPRASASAPAAPDLSALAPIAPASLPLRLSPPPLPPAGLARRSSPPPLPQIPRVRQPSPPSSEPLPQLTVPSPPTEPEPKLEPEVTLGTPLPTQLSFLHPSSTVTSIPPTTTEPPLDLLPVARRKWLVPTLAAGVALLVAATVAMKFMPDPSLQRSTSSTRTATQRGAAAFGSKTSGAASTRAAAPRAIASVDASNAEQRSPSTPDADLTPSPERSGGPLPRATPPARPVPSGTLPSAKDYGI